ncbi:PQQ-binding-like beta-propeller repeat protein [Novosphingobium sp.]|uniref:Vgb family protein n=1 Tax=Novosphingobium sp. TaxID=1874826 RepID=UPI003B5259C7
MKRTLAFLVSWGCCIALAHAALAHAAPVAKPGLPDIQQPMAALPRLATFPIAKVADWVAIAPDAVWVAGKKPDGVHRIDPATQTDTLTVPLPGDACAGLAIGFGSLWVPVCAHKAYSVLRIDSATGRVLAKLPMGPPAEGGIAAGQDAVWFVVDGKTLIAVDPATNAPIRHIAIATGSQVPVVDGDTVWISSTEHDLVTAVDARTGAILGTTPTGPHPRFLAAGGGAIWTMNQGDGTVTRIDARTHTVTATIALGLPGDGGDIAWGDGVVLVTAIGLPLTVIDPQSNRPLTQWVGTGGDSLRYGHGSIWLTDLINGTLIRIDPTAAKHGT